VSRKKIPQTDAIFEQLNQMNAAADAAPDVLRISVDAKATVKVGPFARGGKSRAVTKACDHDFQPAATVTPVGILVPASDELFVYGVTSKVTSDCLVDRLVQWWEVVQERFAHITTLVINLDNGPENQSRRTQFMQRMVDFVRQSGLTVRLTWNGMAPVVDLVTTTYETGVRLSQEAMAVIEAQIERLPSLGKWFIDITPSALRDD
jgi:hypothetical protein